MKTEEVHPRWIGFLFWGISALIAVVLFNDNMDYRMELDLVLFGSIMTGVGIWLAPTKSEHE